MSQQRSTITGSTGRTIQTPLTAESERVLAERPNGEAEPAGAQEPLPRERAAVVHADLPEAPPGSPLSLEWNTYRREAGRLLADGHAGRFVLIKGEEVLGVFDTADEAGQTGRTRFLLEPFLVRPVRDRDPWVRVRGGMVLWPF